MIDYALQLQNIKRISIIAGHYGSGKTNVAVNLALKLRCAHPDTPVTIVDLDIVNPYFRTADFKHMLTEQNIRPILPTFANTNLDTPALPAEVNMVFDQHDGYVIIDVGGDDAGAIALGRYSKQILAEDYDMYYVVNRYRYQTKVASEAVELLAEIEAASRIKATKLINNSNLGMETTLETVTDSFDFAEKISNELGLPLAFCTIKAGIPLTDGIKLEPVEMYVTTI